MSNGRINGGELVNAMLGNKRVIEIAMKNDAGEVARWRPEEFLYEKDLQPVFSDSVKNRPNGELTQSPDYIVHNVSSNKLLVEDGVIKGPKNGGFAMATINKRLTGYRTYIRAKIRSELLNPGGGRLRLQLGGSNKSTNVAPHSQFITAGLYFWDDDADGVREMGAFEASTFRYGFVPNPDPGSLFNYFLTGEGEMRSGDELLLLKEGRQIYGLYNGMYEGPFTLTDLHWVPGYFASILLDDGNALDYLEVGHIGDGRWDQLGDDFSTPSLDHLYNTTATKFRVIDGEVQIDYTKLGTNGTYVAHAFSKKLMHSTDQFIRAELKPPSGSVLGTNLQTILWGRASASSISEATPCVGFTVSMANGYQIVTMVNGTLTTRKSETVANAGNLPVPCEIELQCIGNRYYGLINGTAVIEWIDTGNIVPVNANRCGYGFSEYLNRSSATANTQSPVITSFKALTHSEMPSHETPKLFALSRTKVPLEGALISVVGEGLHKATMFTSDSRPSVIRDDLFRSDNINYFEVPPRPAGVYDVTWVGEGGVSTLLQALEYAGKLNRGAYYPTPTLLEQQTTNTSTPVWYLVPLNPTEPDFTTAPVGGRIVGLKKGHYRLRTRYTFTNYRSDIRHRVVWTGGASTPYVGPASGGSVDNTMEFTVNDDGQVEVQFARTSSMSHTIDSRFQFDLILVSEGRVPIYAVKSGTQLLAATNNVFQQVTGFTNAMIDYVATYDVNAESEMIVPETGQYTLEWQVSSSTANNSNTARVVNQNGTVLASKTTPSTLGRQVVNLTKGDRLRLELSLASSGNVNARTVSTNTVFRIIPVV